MFFPSFHCWNLSLYFCYPTNKIYFICSNFKNDNYLLEYNALRYFKPNVSLYTDTFHCASSIYACMYVSSYGLLDQLRLIFLIRRESWKRVSKNVSFTRTLKIGRVLIHLQAKYCVSLISVLGAVLHNLVLDKLR